MGCLSSSHYGCRTGDCTNILSTDPTWSTTADIFHTHDAADSTTYHYTQISVYLPGYDDPNCPSLGCTVNGNSIWPQPSYSTSSFISLGTNSRFEFVISRPFDVTLTIRCDNGYQYLTPVRRHVKVNCHAASTSVSLPAALQTTQTWTIQYNQVPYLSWPDFDKTEENCPVAYSLTNSAGGSSLPDWQSFTTTYRATNQVDLLSSLKHTEGTYTLYVTGTPEGGFPPVVTPLMTLNVVCGSLSKQFTVPSITSNQLRQKGPSTGAFQFPEFTTAIAGCPIEQYQLVQTGDGTTLHTGFATPSNIISTLSSGTLYAYPTDPTVNVTLNFKLKVITKGGAYETYGPYQLELRCITSHSIVPVSTPVQTDYEFSLEPAGTVITFTLPEYTTTVVGCNIWYYRIDNNNLYGLWLPEAGLTQISGPTACSPQPCREIGVLADRLHSYAFYQFIETEKWQTKLHANLFNITIRCGFETVTVSQSSVTHNYLLTQVDETVTFASQIRGLFQTTKPACDLVLFELFSDSLLTTPYTGSDFTLNNANTPSSTTLTIKQGTRMFTTVYVKGKTQADVYSSVAVNVMICGYESISSNQTWNHTYQMWYQPTDNNTVESWNTLDQYYTYIQGSQSHAMCQNDTLELFHDSALTVPFTNDNRVELQDLGSGQQQLHIWVNHKYALFELYLRRGTNGGHSTWVRYEFEVCGTEIVSLIDPATAWNLTYQQNSGNSAKRQEISSADYYYLFQSNSTFCTPRWWALFEYNNQTNEYVPYEHHRVSLNVALSYMITISTREVWNKMLYLQPQQHGRADYLPINITIEELPYNDTIKDFLNFEPSFKSELSPNLICNVPTDGFDQKEYSIKIPEVHDDFGEFSHMEFDSDMLGSAVYYNTTDEVFHSSQTQIMRYNPDSRKLEFNLEYVKDMMRYAGEHLVTVSLYDERGGLRQYTINVVFDYTPPADEVILPDDRVLPLNFTAWIEYITRTGIMQVKFSKRMMTDNINISHYNSSVIDIYLQPAYYWHEGYQTFNITHFNFTWNTTSFRDDTLMVKLDWFAPEWISCQDILDGLTFHTNYTAQLFVPRDKQKFGERSRAGRMLYRTAPITLYGRVLRQIRPEQEEFESSIETQKNWFSFSILATIFLNQFLGAMLALLLTLIHSLQIILHLPMLTPIFPTNALFYCQKMLPRAQLDWFENIQWYKDWMSTPGNSTVEDSILNQQAELGYDTHNTLVNMGSIHGFVILYIVQLLVLRFIIAPYTAYKGYGHKIVPRLFRIVFYSELLMIGLIGFLQILIASIMAINTPEGHLEDTQSTYVYLLVYITAILAALPAIVYWVIKQEDDKLADATFIRKWGILYEEMKYYAPYSMKYRKFYLWFIARRTLYVLIMFSIPDLPSFQIMLTTFLNLLMIIWFGKYQPFNRKLLNRMELWNEWQVDVATMHLYAFTDFVFDKYTQFEVGWSFIIWSSLQVFLNMLVLSSFAFRRLYLLFLYLRNRYNFRFHELPELRKKVKEFRDKRSGIYKDVFKMLDKVNFQHKGVGISEAMGGRENYENITENNIIRVSEETPDGGMRVRWHSNKYDGEEEKEEGGFRVPDLGMRVLFTGAESKEVLEQIDEDAEEEEPNEGGLRRVVGEENQQQTVSERHPRGNLKLNFVVEDVEQVRTYAPAENQPQEDRNFLRILDELKVEESDGNQKPKKAGLTQVNKVAKNPVNQASGNTGTAKSQNPNNASIRALFNPAQTAAGVQNILGIPQVQDGPGFGLLTPKVQPAPQKPGGIAKDPFSQKAFKNQEARMEINPGLYGGNERFNLFKSVAKMTDGTGSATAQTSKTSRPQPNYENMLAAQLNTASLGRALDRPAKKE